MTSPAARWGRAAVVAALALMIAAASVAATPAPSQVAYPPLGLPELSGLTASVLHPGVIWAVEDSGEPVVRAFDGTGSQVGSVLFEASDVFAGDNRDTESLAMGPGPMLWSADIGDNSGRRETVLVHTTPEPTVLDDRRVAADSYRFSYPDGPHDAETFLVDPVDGRAYIVTKGVLGGGGLYAAPSSLVVGATHELTRVQDLPGLLTGGEFAPDGSLVALRTLGLTGTGAAYLYDVVRSGAGEPVRLRERDEVALPGQEQGEALTFSRQEAALLVGSEGATEPIWSVPLPAGPATGSPHASRPAGATAPGVAAGTPDNGSGTASTTDLAAGDRCRLSALGDCVTGTTGVLALLVAALAVLTAAMVAIHRRS